MAEEFVRVATEVTNVTTARSIGLAELVLLLLVIVCCAYAITKALLLGQKKRSLLLIVGPASSGKTTLFKQLQYGEAPSSTVTSVVPNEEDCRVRQGEGDQGQTVRVVDYPGHVKLRSGCDAYLQRAKKIVFVTDSLVYNDSDSVREAAGFLFSVLANPGVLRHRVPVFIACNKSDRMNAFSVEFVKRRLEKEIDVLLSTVGGLSDTKGGGDDLVNITSVGLGEPFKLANCLSKVSSGAMSALKGNLKTLKPYLTAA
ncbi:subunit beta of signal recognition particle receptor complex [Chloropicon primus]|nr:subunit beta of signal recognition particle receptor complex [Chloropicon primus]UPR04249.1 subunit beta of signal recognition particle receptor complex [Chloropicon primus]|eukprot:QDZ25041.1 subunit beta of signal recognition particle receptor complex [Chloropicon primus]